MNAVAGFGRFWWDFVVGDDWRIAAGVLACLATGAVLVSATDASDAVVSVVVAAGIVAAVALDLATVARGARRESANGQNDAPVR